MRKSDVNGKGGYLGYILHLNNLRIKLVLCRCSEGFNFNLYKSCLDESLNSQSREQTHSLIEKCALSLRLLSYRNFMIHMKVFLQPIIFISDLQGDKVSIKR